MSNKQPQNPEELPENLKRIRKEINAVLDDYSSGPAGDKMTDSLVDVVVAECMELRERIAGRILGQVAERYESVSSEQIEKLANVVLWHYEDPMTGTIEMMDPPKRKGVRLI